MSAPPAALAPPPGHPRFALLDPIRALAALAVLVNHANDFTHPLGTSGAGARLLTNLGRTGVAVFFVLSAFLLFRPFVAADFEGRPRPSVSRFARRRALRLVPALWVALTSLAVWPGLRGIPGADAPAHYLFLQPYRDRWLGQGIIPAWSLAVEVTFYVVLAAVAATRADRAPWRLLGTLAATWVLARGLGAALHAGPLVFYDTLLAWLPAFLAGMALAVLSVLAPVGAVARAVRSAPAAPWLAAAALYATFAVPAVGDSPDAARLVQSAFGALVVAPAVFAADRPGVVRRILTLPGLAALGLVSYGLYLWHYPLVAELDPGEGIGPFVVVALAAGALATAAATASYLLVERPLLRRK